MAMTRDVLRSLLWLGEQPAALPEARTFLCPDGPGPHPAVLYCHAHGGDYTLGRRELTEGRSCLHVPFAKELLDAGIAVLCLDMPCFGDRQSEGSENAASKAALWHGQPLFGRMVAEQLAAFDWLAAQPNIDAGRIATLGISMGAGLAMWTTAIQTRVAACVQLCMLADIAPLIECVAHDRHGHYLTVPGLLRHGDMGDVAAIIAPRPQFVAHGGTDGLAPPAARDSALQSLRAAYGASQCLETFLAPETGHVETPEMRKEIMGFLSRTLTPTRSRTRIPC